MKLIFETLERNEKFDPLRQQDNLWHVLWNFAELGCTA